MEGIFKNISSPTWWIGVVLVGIATSLIAAYLKPKLDLLVGRVSSKWSQRTEERKKQYLKRLNMAKESEHEQIMIATEIVRRLLIGLIFILLSIPFLIVCMFITVIISNKSIHDTSVGYLILCFFFIFVIAMMIGLQQLFGTVKIYSILSKARNLQGERWWSE